MYGIFNFCSGKMYAILKGEFIMGKERICNLFPKGDALKSVIHEVRYQILMQLYRMNKTLENDTGFKDFQKDLNIFEAWIGYGTPTLMVSRSAFERGLNRAKREGWIFMHRSIEEGMNPVKKYRIGLTQKGKEVARHEQIIIYESN